MNLSDFSLDKSGFHGTVKYLCERVVLQRPVTYRYSSDPDTSSARSATLDIEKCPILGPISTIKHFFRD